jgi:hypothetical protein
MSSDPKWQSTFPAIMVFHGDCDDGLDAYKGRPNLNITRDADHCTAFVSFQSAEVAALKAMDAAAPAPARVRELRAKWRLCATAPMPMFLLMFLCFVCSVSRRYHFNNTIAGFLLECKCCTLLVFFL